MGRPRKNKKVTASKKPERQNEEVADVGVPGLFAPQEWDIQEELMGNEALMELQREQRFDF